MKKLILTLIAALGLLVGAHAEETGIPWDKAPNKTNDLAALQNGAKLFVNYCLNCHSAAFMRYNRLQDIGITEQQIKDNLLFTTDKVGETMKANIDARQAKEWFGTVPPDLTLVARSRAGHGGTGADYLYTYLRTFYRDPKTTHGWNNAVFPNAAMPHALWTLQGERGLEIVPHTDKAGHVALEYKWTQLSPGTQNTVQYDVTIRDLVNFLVYVGEPAAGSRKSIGIVVLFVLLGVVLPFAYWMKKEFWKDVK